jgi:hypothetical protein
MLNASPDRSVLEPESKGPRTVIGHFRWVICAVLLFGTTKNYMDRQVIGILKNSLQHQFGWSEIDYGNLVFSFQAAYALGMVVVGRLIDTLGTRLGYGLAMVGWSLASMAHGVMNSLSGFMVVRFALGFGEAGVFPASLKAVAEWFPKKERALATGIFNAGTNVGAVLTPLLVPWITGRWGWRWAFFLIGALGLFWLLVWGWLYRKPEDHRRCSPSELQYIVRDRAAVTEKIGWLKLLPHRQTWAFAAGKFIIDPIWWFYLSVLDTRFSATYSRPGTAQNRATNCGHLPDCGWRQCRGRMVLIVAHTSGQECEQRPQDRHAGVRRLCGADHLRPENRVLMGSGSAHRAGGRGASGVLGQSADIAFRYVSFKGCCFGCRNWRYGGCHRRHVYREVGGILPAMDGQLPCPFPDCGNGLLGCVRSDSLAGARPAARAVQCGTWSLTCNV